MIIAGIGLQENLFTHFIKNGPIKMENTFYLRQLSQMAPEAALRSNLTEVVMSSNIFCHPLSFHLSNYLHMSFLITVP